MNQVLIHDALGEWAAILGPEHLIARKQDLSLAQTATFETHQTVPVILRPENVEQVQEIVRVANRYNFPVYPVSSGRNWGYGSRVPASDGCALLDLCRLNKITAFDRRLGYVTVQPGVTQQHLWNFLQERGAPFWMDATGSSPDCSLIGNVMERGFGHTPYGDHFSQVCAFEVILPNSDLIRTGYAGLPAAQGANVYRWGLGPSLDGLFSQSNLGIVTGMTIWLMPAPSCFQGFFFQSDREEGLQEIVEALRPLRLDGTLRSAVHIGNDYKVLAGISQFPWEEQAPLSRESMKGLRARLKFSRWSGSGALYGTPKQVAESRRLVREALRGKVEKLQFLNDRTLSLASRFKTQYRWITGIDLTRTLELLRPVYGLLKGVPTKETLGSVYWRKRMPVPDDPDPDRDRCGVLWLAPVAPMLGESAKQLVELTEQTLLAHGFEPQISITLLTERSLSCVISISFDRDVPGEDARAMECYRQLRARLDAEGYYSYRLGISGMPMPLLNPAYANALNSIKAALDPNQILAPGRYAPASS